MTRKQLRKRLQALEPKSTHPLDMGASHGVADALLLEYINDHKATQAYKDITDWMAWVAQTAYKADQNRGQ